MKKKHMKKKQLAKLKEQFKPSWQDAQYLLFNSMKDQAKSIYDLSIEVYIQSETSSDMIIELLDPTTRDQQIKVPLDDNFKVVVKRIQNNEKDLLDRFSKNLVEEIASYWIPEKLNEKQTPLAKEQLITSDTKDVDNLVEEAITPSSETATFIAQMADFPKFFVNQTNENLEIFEKNAKEDRLLATISMVDEATFSIEAPLERKYKLKLEVIPLIEAFAALPIKNR